jgi:hypothetical protein
LQKKLGTAISKNAKDDILQTAQRYAKSGRRIAALTKISEAIAHIRENASVIVDSAARNKSKDKSPPNEYASSLQLICVAADALPSISSLMAFKREIVGGLYGAPVATQLSGRASIPENVRQALFDEPVAPEELSAGILEAATRIGADIVALEQLLSISLGGGIPVGPPGSFQPPPANYPPSQTNYVANPGLIVPIQLPEFPRERWAVLADQVYNAVR